MATIDRRDFLGTSLGGLAVALGASGCSHSAAQPATADAGAAAMKPDTLFLTWQRDPTTTMTVQWIGKPLAADASTIQFAQLGKDQWQSLKPSERAYPMTDLTAFRAEMTGLTPGTEYQ